MSCSLPIATTWYDKFPTYTKGTDIVAMVNNMDLNTMYVGRRAQDIAEIAPIPYQSCHYATLSTMTPLRQG